MAKKNGFFSRYRFVYKPSPILLKCAALVMLVVAVGALTVLSIRIHETKQHNDYLRIQAAQQEEENRKDAWMIENKDTVEGVKTISTDKMGMAEGNTAFYDVVTNQD